MSAGTVYLLCFAQGLRRDDRAHVRHYIGWTGNGVQTRLAAHQAGTGSPLIKAALAAGLELHVARTWENRDRNFERALKRQRNASRYCPLCTPGALDREPPRLTRSTT